MYQMGRYDGKKADTGPMCKALMLNKPAELSKHIQFVQPDGKVRLGYHWFRSSSFRPDLPLFFAVHGIGRRAKDQARFFAPLVEAIGGMVVAPVFGKSQFSGYQRLRQTKQDVRSDLAFQHLVAHVHRKLEIPRAPVVLFGYSGGGQFVHRFAMAYPRLVKRMAIAAPGWFTFPDKGIRFPRGISETSVLPDLTFDSARFLKIPSLVLVGDNDVDRDKSLNQRRDIDEQQGRHRLERANSWIDAMRSAAGRYHYETPLQLNTIPGCAHSFRDCMETGQMGWSVIRFLFDGFI